MVSEDQEQPANPFPLEYAHVDVWVRDAEAQLQQLNIELSRKEVEPRLKFAPPGYALGHHVAPQRTKEEIQQEKDDLKAVVLKRIAKETLDAAPKIRVLVQDKAFGRLYAEDIKKFAIVERGLPQPSAGWSLENAQTKLQIQIIEDRDKHRTDKALDKGEGLTLDAMTERFVEKLELPQLQLPEKADSLAEPGIEPEAPEWDLEP